VERGFLENLFQTLMPIRFSLSFCDHYIVNSNGTINYPATEENTRRWKRWELKKEFINLSVKLGWYIKLYLLLLLLLFERCD